MKVFNGKCWTAPTISNGMLYVRSLNEAAAIDIRKQEPVQ